MFIIAEVGCNHQGSLDKAIEMIKVASEHCGVDAVKFQKRNPKECLTKEQYKAPHPVPENSYGKTYGEHRKMLEFDIFQHAILKQECLRRDVAYGCSIWDLTSLEEMISVEPDYIKFPSAWNTNEEALRKAFENFNKVHISLGMTTLEEEDAINELLQRNKWESRAVIYACTSGYPVDFHDLCLREISRLNNKFMLSEIGFSGHHLGIAADIAAMTLGAKYIERHFTLDRTLKGTDHSASLEPDGLRKLVRDVHNVEKALTYKPSLLEVEQVQRRKLKRC